MTEESIVREVLRRAKLPSPVTSENLVAAVREVMEVVEAFQRGGGEQKKAIVLECIDTLLRETDSGAALEAVEPAVRALLPHLIDELVVCSRTGIRINDQYASKRSCRCLGAFLRRLCCRVCRGSRA